MPDERLTEWTSIEQLCDRYFHARPSPESLALLKRTETERTEVREFTERTLWLMKLSRFSPNDISPAMAWWIGTLTGTRILPGAFEGAVQPITSAGRHRRIDDYLAANPWKAPAPGSVILDMGCASPPLSTLDTAARFPACQVIGADPAFAVSDANHAAANLSTIRAGIGDAVPPADIIRCMNVLLYYDADFRARAESWAARTLRPGGLFLCGTNGWRSFESRYSVYQKEHAQEHDDDSHLVAREFAFSLDNVRPFTGIPWLALHDDERETWLLARAVAILRADEPFRRDYDTRLDRLLHAAHILDRGPDNCLHTPPDPIPPLEWPEAAEQVVATLEAEEFVDRAVQVLRSAGLSAWRNAAGHIALPPGEPS